MVVYQYHKSCPCLSSESLKQVSQTSSMAEYSTSSSSAREVAANSDILIQILIRLPVKSLMIFKSVSKHWLSIITSHFFALLRYHDSSIVSGLFHHPGSNPSRALNFIPLVNTTETPTHDPHPKFTDLALPPDLPARIRIISSCHGLLLCCFGHNHDDNPKPNYFILNPTTKQFKNLPRCHISDLICLTLAFDPSKSPHYKVVCVYMDSVPTDRTEPYHFIMTYSSETGLWKAPGMQFVAKCKTKYESGVYWNGAVNWFHSGSDGDLLVYYNVEDERLGSIPPPPIPEGNDRHNYRAYSHCEESRGHLHLVDEFVGTARVHELERDYSRWFLKFSVDLRSVGILRDIRLCPYSILCVVRMERDEESFLVLHVPGKILRYVFGDGTLKKIRDEPIPNSLQCIRRRRRWHFAWRGRKSCRLDSFQYIESLFGI